MQRGLVALLALVVMGNALDAAGEAFAPRHAYYLFLADVPQGCEDCYAPLLLARQTLEEIAALGRDGMIVLITTYERDSIWKLEQNVSLAAADVAARERIVRVRGRRYRYLEIGPAEVLRLLEKPEGSIPIHRIMPVPDRKLLEELIAAFRGAKSGGLR